MSFDNDCRFIGNFVADPKLRTVSGKDGDISVVNFNLGVNNRRTDTAVFPEFEVWGAQADVIVKYCHKGDKIGVVGELKIDKYDDKDGNTVYRSKYRVNDFVFLGSKNGGAGSEEGDGAEEASVRPKGKAAAKPKAKPKPEVDLDDDDIKF